MTYCFFFSLAYLAADLFVGDNFFLLFIILILFFLAFYMDISVAEVVVLVNEVKEFLVIILKYLLVCICESSRCLVCA